MQQPDKNIRNIISYYSDTFDEQARLSGPWGEIEFIRTQLIIQRYIKPPPAVVLDVGGAAGAYACWLATKGYEVHLLDPVLRHIQQASAASAAQPLHPLASCKLGDARHLDFEDSQVDAVLLMGPLYHLIEAQDRKQALAEAYRVLKPNGRLFAVGISRFASTIDGLASGYFTDPGFKDIMLRDLEDGQHRNPTLNPAYFTDAYFHHPDKLITELIDAGFQLKTLQAIEGIAYVVENLAEHWANADRRIFLLELIDKISQDPSMIGASPHIMGVGSKPRPRVTDSV